MTDIDGSFGEGGGQILRTSLALSLITRAPFRIRNVRAGRARPGLMRQHLAAVRAAATVGDAEVSGDAIGSLELTFKPRSLVAGEHLFQVGSAGSATLVLQTILLPLLAAKAPSTITLEGGTHNPMAPTFGFLERAFLPLLHRMGARVTVLLERPGFYPAGGGRMKISVEPGALSRLDLVERGEVNEVRATAIISALPFAIAKRELEVVSARMDWAAEHCRPLVITDAAGPGNVLELEIACAHVTELFTGFGEKGVRAETVAETVADEAKAWLAAGVPVGAHLADQLLLPMALAGGGSFVTTAPTPHSETQRLTIARFLDVAIAVEEVRAGAFRFRVGDGKS